MNGKILFGENTTNIEGLKVAILVENGFEQSEMTEPRMALDRAGAKTQIVSPAEGDNVRGWKSKDWGDEFPIDVHLEQANPGRYDALLLPGGVMNPDRLRMQPKAVEFVSAFFDDQRPVAMICHGPWTILEASRVRGRKITSWPSLKTDLRNAGANWIDQEVVVDGNMVSSRKPDDIPAFNREMIRLFGKSKSSRRDDQAEARVPNHPWLD